MSPLAREARAASRDDRSAPYCRVYRERVPRGHGHSGATIGGDPAHRDTDRRTSRAACSWPLLPSRRAQDAAVRRRVPFFLTVNPNRPIARHSVLSPAAVGSAVRNSASVAWAGAVSQASRSSPGRTRDGTLFQGSTCSDWTSDSAAVAAQVGHTRTGWVPTRVPAARCASWNSAHASQNCADTAPRGGAGRFYCFAR